MTRPYEDLKFYQDICEIRKLIIHITERFPRSLIRLISQMRDSARSAKQNIREGYRKGTLGEFLHSIRISLGSLEELSGDMEDCFQDNLITKLEFEKFTKLYNSASYLSTKYLIAMSSDQAKQNWRIPATGNVKKPKVTIRNLMEPLN